MTPPEELLLTFSGSMPDPSSCVPSALTLTTLLDPIVSYTLTSATCRLVSTTVLEVVISQEDLIRLQSFTGLADSAGSTFLNVSSGFIQDSMMNPSRDVMGVPVQNFVHNLNPPMVVDAAIDLDAGVIELTFSEGVVGSSLNLGTLTVSFINSQRGLRVNHTIFEGQLTIGGALVEIQLSAANLNIFLVIGRNGSAVFLCLERGFISDANSEPNEAQKNIMLSQFTADDTPPSIVTYSIDLDRGLLLFHLSEPYSDINSSLLFLAPQSTGGENFTSLTGRIFPHVTNTQAYLELSAAVLNAIKVDMSLCEDLNSCFLIPTNGSYIDVSGNKLIEGNTRIALIRYTADTTGPRLDSYYVNLTHGTLDLNFNEPVDLASLSVDGITFFNSLNPSQSQTLTGFTSDPTGFRTEIIVMGLSENLLIFLRAMVASTNLRMNMSSSTIIDTRGNPVQPVNQASSARLPRDTVPPYLVSFNPGLPEAQAIVLQFNEFVEASTWNGSHLSLTLQLPTHDVIYTDFTSGMLSPGISDRITYSFSNSELNRTQSPLETFAGQYSEAFFNGSIVLQAEPGLIRDFYWGHLFSTTQTLMYPREQTDITSPSITGFDLDLTRGSLLLTFSEPVVILNFTQRIQLVNTQAPISESVTIQDVLQVSMETTQMGARLIHLISISFDDLNNILASTDLCTSTADCFIVVISGLAEDRSGNVIATTSLPVEISSNGLVEDTISPGLISFDLDLNSGVISFTYSEPVNISTINTTALTFEASAVFYTLHDGAITRVSNQSTIFDLSLTLIDLNQVKFVYFQDPGNMTLNLSSTFVRDFNGNPSLSLGSLQPIQIIPDMVPPQLLSINNNINNIYDLIFTFSEFVRDDIFHEDLMTIVLRIPEGIFMYTGFNGGQVLNQLIEINYLFPEMGNFSQHFMQALENGSVSLMTERGLVADLNNNLMLPITSPPLVYTTDLTPPTLLSFTLDLNVGRFELTFSEPVNVGLTAGQLHFQNMAENPSIIITLTKNGIVTPAVVASQVITLGLSMVDRARIQAERNVGTSRSNSFLQLEQSFAIDLGANLLLPHAQGLQPSVFTEDSSREGESIQNNCVCIIAY